MAWRRNQYQRHKSLSTLGKESKWNLEVTEMGGGEAFKRFF